MAVPKFVELAIHWGTQAMQSSYGQELISNWTRPITPERGQGHQWTLIPGDDKTDSIHENNYSKERYPADSCDWALAKTVGIAVVGKYIFGAALLRSMGAFVYETSRACYGMYQNHAALKNETGFKFTTFARNELSNFTKAGEHLKNVGKNFVCFIPFYFSLYGVNSALITGSLAYTAFDPLSARVYLNKVEDWRRGPLKPLTDREIKELSPWGAWTHLTDGSYSLLNVFNMHRLGKPVEKKQE